MTKQVYKPIDVFEITGSDTIDFFNNQIISKPQADGSIQFSAICNPKGRILFTLVLKASPEHMLVAVDGTLGDNFLHYVNMRRFRMNLNINKSNHFLAFTVDSQLDLAFDFIGSSTTYTDIDHDQFWSNIFQMQLPWVTLETSEKFIPQHLNLDQNNVIDFAKGCYPGQEIIARLHFIGKVKKRMQLINYQSSDPCSPGSSAQIGPNQAAVDICAPSIMTDQQWQTQAIVNTNNAE